MLSKIAINTTSKKQNVSQEWQHIPTIPSLESLGERIENSKAIKSSEFRAIRIPCLKIINQTEIWAGDAALWVECLLSIQGALGFNPWH